MCAWEGSHPLTPIGRFLCFVRKAHQMCLSIWPCTPTTPSRKQCQETHTSLAFGMVQPREPPMPEHEASGRPSRTLVQHQPILQNKQRPKYATLPCPGAMSQGIRLGLRTSGDTNVSTCSSSSLPPTSRAINTSPMNTYSWSTIRPPLQKMSLPPYKRPKN